MFKQILVPLDGSDFAEEALHVAAQLANTIGARLDVCYVVDVARIAALMGSFPVSLQPAIQAMEVDAKGVLERAAQTVAPNRPRTFMLSGVPADEIVGCAHKNGADLIVMGSHGRSGLQRFLLGSVTEAVLRQSHIPVLVSRKKRAALTAPNPNSVGAGSAV